MGYKDVIKINREGFKCKLVQGSNGQLFFMNLGDQVVGFLNVRFVAIDRVTVLGTFVDNCISRGGTRIGYPPIGTAIVEITIESLSTGAKVSESAYL